MYLRIFKAIDPFNVILNFIAVKLKCVIKELTLLYITIT